MKKTLRAYIQYMMREYEWIHTFIGLFGNFAFFVGSVFFLWKDFKTAGVWLFIVGAFGMMIGSIGDTVVRFEWHKGKLESAANYSHSQAAAKKRRQTGDEDAPGDAAVGSS